MNTADDSIRVRQTGRSAFWTPLLLAAAIFAAVLLNNAEPIFRAAHYETSDPAANSLQIIRAKHFQLFTGNYSRFGFYHPGPAFFYLYGASEAVFYDALHLVPTPFNAQLIALFALSAFLFSMALAVIWRRLDNATRKWFVGLALLLAAWHFGTVGKYYDFIPGRYGLFCNWPPCVLVFPFLCLLVAGASVAAGEGRDLPLMTLGACLLVHGHVAMPLFVVPITLLAYGNLLLWSRRAGAGRSAWPWQVFPRQHWFATGIILLFVTPLVIDLAVSTPSNFQLIVDHLRSGHPERKSLFRSILYFVHFGAYASYPNSNTIPAFENFDLAGTVEFFRKHYRAYALWLGVVAAPFVFLKINRRSRTEHVDTRTEKILTPELRTFLVRIYLLVGLAIGLTIIWGCLQEGPMYYYNALFNFAIYYSLLLVFAVTAAQWVTHWALVSPAGSNSDSPDWFKKLRGIGLLFIALAVVIVLGEEAPRFRYLGADPTGQKLFANAMERAVQLDSAEPKLLSFEGQAWAEAVGAALYLQRAGADWYVAEYARPIRFIFGQDRAIPEKETAIRLPHASVWRIVSTASRMNIMAKEPGLVALPLAKDIDLVVRPSP